MQNLWVAPECSKERATDADRNTRYCHRDFSDLCTLCRESGLGRFLFAWTPKALEATARSVSGGKQAACAPVGRANITVGSDLDRVRRRLRWRRRHLVAALDQAFEDLGADARLDIKLVRLPLVMYARRADRLIDRQIEVDHIGDD